MHDRVDDQARDQGAVGIGADRGFIHHLFHHHNDAFGGKRHLLLHTEQAPQLCIASPVRALRVKNRDIGMERWHDGDLAGAVGIVDQFDQRIRREHIGAHVATQRKEGRTGRAGRITPDQAVM